MNVYVGNCFVKCLNCSIEIRSLVISPLQFYVSGKLMLDEALKIISFYNLADLEYFSNWTKQTVCNFIIGMFSTIKLQEILLALK